jgi:hypothetical protein
MIIEDMKIPDSFSTSLISFLFEEPPTWRQLQDYDHVLANNLQQLFHLPEEVLSTFDFDDVGKQALSKSMLPSYVELQVLLVVLSVYVLSTVHH